MWSLLDELPKTHTPGTFGGLDYMSGGHSQLARLSAWLGSSGIRRPIFDQDQSQCFSVADNDEMRCHKEDWQTLDRAIEFLARHKDGGKPFFLYLSSDHGEMALEHQDWYKMSMYEGSVCVPLVLAGPGVQQGQRLSNLVSLIDLCRTFMEMAGLGMQNGLDGESLLPLATGHTMDSRAWAYACFMGCTLNSSAYMFRKDRWKYVVYAGTAPNCSTWKTVRRNYWI